MEIFSRRYWVRAREGERMISSPHKKETTNPFYENWLDSCLCVNVFLRRAHGKQVTATIKNSYLLSSLIGENIFDHYLYLIAVHDTPIVDLLCDCCRSLCTKSMRILMISGICDGENTIGLCVCVRTAGMEMRHSWICGCLCCVRECCVSTFLIKPITYIHNLHTRMHLRRYFIRCKCVIKVSFTEICRLLFICGSKYTRNWI